MSVFKPELCEECATLYKYNQRLREVVALRGEIDVLKSFMDFNPSSVTTCMGKPFKYWIELQSQNDTLYKRLDIAIEALKCAEYALSHLYSDQKFAHNACLDALAEIAIGEKIMVADMWKYPKGEGMRGKCLICGDEFQNYADTCENLHTVQDVSAYGYILSKQLNIAVEWIRSMVINDGTHADISILAERKLAEIEKVKNDNQPR